MHVLQPKHKKLTNQEADKLLKELNISPAQLPKIRINDPAIPEETQIGDIIRIERVVENKTTYYYRVVVV
jgi:DNA-directed RNA polymerase subunit H